MPGCLGRCPGVNKLGIDILQRSPATRRHSKHLKTISFSYPEGYELSYIQFESPSVGDRQPTPVTELKPAEAPCQTVQNLPRHLPEHSAACKPLSISKAGNGSGNRSKHWSLKFVSPRR